MARRQNKRWLDTLDVGHDDVGNDRFYMRGNTMSTTITTTGLCDIWLIVSDMDRSLDFYTGLLNFTLVRNFYKSALLTNGSMFLGLTSGNEEDYTTTGKDQLSFAQIGLGHISLGVANRAELYHALALLDERGVEHIAITDLCELGLTVLCCNDPDGIEVILTTQIKSCDILLF
jgi:catechol 2,3-dioxygenase-like lactoylglutathione lyase family enzyme